MELPNRKIHIIGINSFEFKDLPYIQQKLIKNTNNIVVPISFIDEIKKWFDKNLDEKIFFASNSNYELINWLKTTKDEIILLSRGDPLWFGIGRILIDNFSKEELYFYPSITCVQQAFCKLKKTWQDIKCISIHGRDSTELIKALK